jgi:hypothetical protein
MFTFRYCVATLLALLLTSVVQGSGSESLYVLANQYREAVDQFERTLRTVRGIDGADRGLVGRLDDTSSKLRLAAKNPRHLNRLHHEWKSAQSLHAQVEERLFGKYTPNHELILAWNDVAYSFVVFAEEYYFQIENPSHVGGVRRRVESSARRNSYLAEPVVTPLNAPRLPSGAILLTPPQP